VQSFPASGANGRYQSAEEINRKGARWERTLLFEPRQKAHGSPGEDGSDFRERNSSAVVSDSSHADKFNGCARNNYVATANGQRFLVNNVVEDTASQPITVVLNWTAQLKK